MINPATKAITIVMIAIIRLFNEPSGLAKAIILIILGEENTYSTTFIIPANNPAILEAIIDAIKAFFQRIKTP